jgi:hypothetical protein
MRSAGLYKDTASATRILTARMVNVLPNQPGSRIDWAVSSEYEGAQPVTARPATRRICLTATSRNITISGYPLGPGCLLKEFANRPVSHSPAREMLSLE